MKNVLFAVLIYVTMMPIDIKLENKFLENLNSFIIKIRMAFDNKKIRIVDYFIEINGNLMCFSTTMNPSIDVNDYEAMGKDLAVLDMVRVFSSIKEEH